MKKDEKHYGPFTTLSVWIMVALFGLVTYMTLVRLIQVLAS